MADDSDKQDTPGLPPKLDLRKQGILKKAPLGKPESAPKQETSRLVVEPAAAPADASAPESPPPAEGAADIKLKPLKPKPAPIAVKPETPADTAKPAAAAPEAGAEPDPTKTDTKRKTSRIPLEKAKSPDGEAEEPAGLKPTAIKIKPGTPLPKIRGKQPLSITMPMSEDIGADAEKRKTSRIPLEEALTADKETDAPADPADSDRPKTIKIKRPGSGDGSAVKLEIPPAEEDKAGVRALGETARLDNLPLDLPDSAATQKKTIRVKRPPASGGGPALASSPAVPAGLGLMPPPPLEQESDEPGVLWAVMGLAAMLVLCVVVYMLAAQAIGPNSSGTQLSSWKAGPSLTWPGKILN